MKVLIIIFILIVLCIHDSMINNVINKQKNIDNHLNICAHKIKEMQYQIDVLTELQRQMK